MSEGGRVFFFSSLFLFRQVCFRFSRGRHHRIVVSGSGPWLSHYRRVLLVAIPTKVAVARVDSALRRRQHAR